MTTNITMLVRNRPNLTRQALETLKPYEFDCNVTILDDRSDEETTSILRDWCLLQNANYWRNDQPVGTGQLRNMVIEASRLRYGSGDYLYLADNDCAFKDGWLDNLTWVYENAQCTILGAYGHPYHQPINSYAVGEFTVHNVFALATQSILMTWDVWDEYGPFCQTPVDRVCQSEDVDFANRIRNDGGSIGVVDPPLLVATGITNTFGEKIPGWDLVKAQAPEGIVVE